MKASQLKGMNNKARLIDRQILKGKKAMIIKGMNSKQNEGTETDPRQKDFDEREQPKKHDVAQRDRPAFPTNARMFDSAQGMTKREYFAGLALQGVLAGDAFAEMTTAAIVNEAITHADELLKQLET